MNVELPVAVDVPLPVPVQQEITNPDQEATTAASSSSCLSIIQNHLLGKKIKCTMEDGRVVEGTFICLDRIKNIVLTNATEVRKVKASIYETMNTSNDEDLNLDHAGNGHGNEKIQVGEEEEEYRTFRRAISQVLIPGSQIKKVETDQDFMEKSM
mmetsp:Transcript_9001/g.11332  ORF Transcript_9001/g.11332 Transcript_9001/m.11332 type:complete len:155 (-) Transcript_9001:121-585(-)